mmetsp:Transcript_6443/g.9888  ORF Transcript_6443/g.9888 Transcript_6443/m.9888 type:complete len:125 (-) Transcript_6443:198-572(-)
MTVEEKTAPGMLSPQGWRKVANRVPPNWNVTVADVRDMIHRSAQIMIVMNRMDTELKSGRHKAPTTKEEFANIVKQSQLNLTQEQRIAEVKKMNGAFPGNGFCPCASRKKYKSCCDPKKKRQLW